ncbi:hypothetical protein QQG74_09725 [Micromonospora sp. FIMYZ51]|uniref:hypothetical protein n=1 Tax=Micromonospora sp. FIMYZ51 TaxID=3051832 RepID=UPI0031202980
MTANDGMTPVAAWLAEQGIDPSTVPVGAQAKIQPGAPGRPARLTVDCFIGCTDTGQPAPGSLTPVTVNVVSAAPWWTPEEVTWYMPPAPTQD